MEIIFLTFKSALSVHVYLISSGLNCMCCGTEYEGTHVICPVLTLNTLPEMELGSASFLGEFWLTPDSLSLPKSNFIAFFVIKIRDLRPISIKLTKLIFSEMEQEKT